MKKETHAKWTSLSSKKPGREARPGGLVEKRKGEGWISPSFRRIILDLRDFLGEMKQKLDAEEASISRGNPDQRLRLEREVLDAVEMGATEYINHCIAGMTDVVKHFTHQEHHSHRNYFQQHLHSFLLLSPFVKRAYLKPLGIPGDYEMMNMLYGNHDQGETLFARLINRYSCRVTAARAVTGRIPYMLGKLNHTLERVLKERATASIMSVGCGPAQEIQALIRTNPMSDRCRVTLIDAEPEALRYCHARIDDLRKATRRRMKFCCLNQSVRQLILDPSSLLDMMGGQDLIYAMGLFDYLPFHVAKGLVQRLCRSLSEGGELIVGNLSISDNVRYGMEYAVEWFVFSRFIEELYSLADETPFPSEVSLEADEGGTQLYLVIRKEEGLNILPRNYSEMVMISHGNV